MSQSYVTPKIVEECHLKKSKHLKSWLEKLTTSMKRKVSEVVNECLVEVNRLVRKVNLNIIPLGSYQTLIGMDCLELHRAKVDCYDKIVECIDDKG